jgi:hypothetical protein
MKTFAAFHPKPPCGSCKSGKYRPKSAAVLKKERLERLLRKVENLRGLICS